MAGPVGDTERIHGWRYLEAQRELAATHYIDIPIPGVGASSGRYIPADS